METFAAKAVPPRKFRLFMFLWCGIGDGNGKGSYPKSRCREKELPWGVVKGNCSVDFQVKSSLAGFFQKVGLSSSESNLR